MLILRIGGLVDFHCFGLVRRGGPEVNVHGLGLVRRGFPPEGPAVEGPGSAGSLNSTEGLGMSRSKMFGGTVVHPDGILASSSASSLYLCGT